MTQQYKLTGLSCGGCVATFKKVLSQVEGVESIDVSPKLDEATVTMSQTVSTASLKDALASRTRFTIADKVDPSGNRPASINVPILQEIVTPSPKKMTQSYQLTGLTCDGCVATVKNKLLLVPGVKSVEINAARDEATVEMAGPISTETLKMALASSPKYTIADKSATASAPAATAAEVVLDEPEKSWLATYQPLLTLFAFITGVAGLAAWQNGAFDGMAAMRYFMAGFFLAFSFFKMLNLTGFADSYNMYDVLAKQWRGYGFVYPFIELALGLAYLTNFQPFATNVATIAVMGFSTIGVLQSVMNKRKIRCACLGAVFNLPMSTVTIVEDLLMVAMAVSMILIMA